MRSKLFQWGLLLLAFAITLCCFIANYSEKRQKQQANLERMTKKSEFEKMNGELNEKLSNTTLQDIPCQDSDEKTHLLSTLVLRHPVLIFRYSELNCNTCYESELASLQSVFSNDDMNKVIIFCSYQIRSYFTVFKKVNQIKCSFYRISQETFNWMIEDYNSPYYFILHPDMKSTNFYIPSKVFPDLNIKYLEEMKQLLSKGSGSNGGTTDNRPKAGPSSSSKVSCHFKGTLSNSQSSSNSNSSSWSFNGSTKRISQFGTIKTC